MWGSNACAAAGGLADRPGPTGARSRASATRSECVVLVRALGATRTRDLLLRRQLLYPLSYQGSCGGVEVPLSCGFLSSAAGVRLAHAAMASAFPLLR